MKSQELRRPVSKPAASSCCDNAHPHEHSSAEKKPEDKPYTDPVCGMKAAANPEKMATHDGTVYYFCSKGCVAKFTADPQRYLDPSSYIAPPVAADAVYTCPMHPEI